MAGYEAYERTVEVGLILEIAEALRAEFGVSIDAHPGGRGSEAGAINRAFRATARRILQPIVPVDGDLNRVLTWVLRRAASIRLAEVGVGADLSATVVDSEPGLGDAWLACLALAPEVVIIRLAGESFRDD